MKRNKKMKDEEKCALKNVRCGKVQNYSESRENTCNAFRGILNILRVNVRTIQSGAEQGSVDLTDFHIYCSVFHADSRGAIHFS